MRSPSAVLAKISMFAASLAVLAPLMAQEPAAPVAPTAKNPLRFTAFAVSMGVGGATQVQIAIERWTTESERQGLLSLLAGTSFKSGGQDKLLKALQAVTPRTGFIKSATSMGWDLKYAWSSTLPDGTRQIVVVTDKPVAFLSAANNADTMNYPFTFVEMRIGPDHKGEGRVLVATAVSTENGKLELQHYGQEPVRLTTITENVPKPKKPKS